MDIYPRSAVVQMDGAALTMPKAKFVEAYHAHPQLRELVNRYQSILLMQAQAECVPATRSTPSAVAFAAGSCNPRT